jgi:peptide-methionine (R)-S-oxide reductase
MMFTLRTRDALVALILGFGLMTTGCWTSSSAEDDGSSNTSTSSQESSATTMTGQARQARGDGSGNADQDRRRKAETTKPGKRIDPGEVPQAGTQVSLSESEWRERLDDTTFRIMREAGTERAGSGELLHNKKAGIYYCAACGAPLYSSRHKFDSGTGWPSYYKGWSEDRLGTKVDNSMGMTRTEVHCARCGGHLGHIFDDGPDPTGKRHCINSAALTFRPANEEGVVENPPEPIPSDADRADAADK